MANILGKVMDQIQAAGEDHSALLRERDMFRSKFLTAQQNYENKLREISSIKTLSDILRSSHFGDRASVITRQLKAIVHHDAGLRAQLVLLEKGCRKAELVADSRAEDPKALPRPCPLGQELIEKIALTRKPVHEAMNNVEAGTQGSDAMIHRVSVPLLQNHHLIGILLFSREAASFTNHETSFFSLIADQIATLVVLYSVYDKMLHEERSRHTLSRFFSSKVSRQIMQGADIRPGGQRAKVAVMFVDMDSFSVIAERLNQETVVTVLNAFFAYTIPIVFEHDGTLDKLLGDGFLAFFGAPIPAPDDTLRALTTACRLQEAMAEFNALHKAKGWPKLHLSVGLNVGEVVAGYVGSDQHLSYTVIGRNVNLAQRIQSVAGPGEILVSQAVFDEVVDRLDALPGVVGLVPLELLHLKGKDEPVRLYQVQRKPWTAASSHRRLSTAKH